MSRGQRTGGPLLGRATKGIGSLIGAGTEAYAHHKDKREQAKMQQAHGTAETEAHTTSETKDYHDADGNDEHPDEEDWALDDASDELSARPQQHAQTSLLDTLGLEHPPIPLLPLAYPVILPQRRPQTKSRGFVRAYAPVLDECKGIDQATFLRFLDEFYNSTQTSGWLQAVNVASQAVGAVPSPIAMAVSAGVNAGVRAGTEAQSRYKTNSYLDAINKKLFNPRNLQCVIMTFRPDSSQTMIDVDIHAAGTAISKAASNTQPQGIQSKFKGTSGTSHSEFSIPDAAPLIYPAVDHAAFAASQNNEPLAPQKQNALKRSSDFISEYLDRRAQAEYTGTQGPTSKLNVPGATEQQKFASRYADPNHPANSGGIVALLTGGTVDPLKRRRGRRADRRASHRGEELTEQDRINVAMGRGVQGQKKGIVRTGLKKIISEDVLYLLIAEIPSMEETAAMQRMGA